MDERTLWEIVTRQERGEKFAVGLLCHVQGSAPQKAGARLIVLPDGSMIGTVGGGCLEMETRRRALLALRTGESSLFELRLDDDFGWDDGLICGGKTTLLVTPHPEHMTPALNHALNLRETGERCALHTMLEIGSRTPLGETQCRVIESSDDPSLSLIRNRPEIRTVEGVRTLIETVLPNPRLYVCGCGHIGAAVVEYASSVGFDVTAIDDRADYASKQRIPLAKQVLCMDMVEAAATLPTNRDTYWVIVTRGHRNDGKVLAGVIGRSHAYIGMIGSRRKVRIIRDGLVKEGIATVQQLDHVHSPVGLDIGGESPQEIALSIAAELVAVRRGKKPS
jgi:xanthine dehydrogenase accessory factor